MGAPHDILNGMKRVREHAGDEFDTTFSPEVWGAVEASLKGPCVDFDFGDAVPDKAHLEFVNGLLDRGLFRLPFPEVLFRGRAMPYSSVLAQQYPNSKFTLICTTIGPIQTPDRSMLGCGPLLVLGLHGDRLENMRVDWKSATTRPHHSRKTGQQWTEDTYEDKTELVLNWVCGLTALLMSKDIDVSTVRPSPRLNRDRIAKGKLPIGERRVVRIRAHAVEAQRQALADFTSGRASPVIHWRRGHFRRIREDLIVPIAPMIVGARESANPPKPKDYRL